MSAEHVSMNQSTDPRIGACVYLLHGLLQRLERQQPGLLAEMTEGILRDRSAMDPASSSAAAAGYQVADEALRMLQLMNAQLIQASTSKSTV
ncbi:hypothetical protein [Comamonas odontotermitis]|uniref:hypothetical protein n=1 Tax=Comamonas odontotermitis TaxID=379895 RepID=UPI003750045B